MLSQLAGRDNGILRGLRAAPLNLPVCHRIVTQLLPSRSAQKVLMILATAYGSAPRFATGLVSVNVSPRENFRVSP